MDVTPSPAISSLLKLFFVLQDRLNDGAKRILIKISIV